jgi:opacity protein-like surface antigen
MSKSRWLVPALICSLVAMPTISNAQAADSTKEQAQNFGHDVLKALFGPNKNLFVQGGFTRSDRYVLQQAVNTIGGERSLQGKNGYNVGGGVGVDFLLRQGLRLSYSFSSTDLKFKTNNGNGSDALDIDDVGRLKSHTATLEIMRYMLPAKARFTPYGTLGAQGTWWVLDEKSVTIVPATGAPTNVVLVTSNGAGTPFSMGPLFSFGLQFKPTDQWSGRLEATLASEHNPFTGNKSFRALSGPTIDEPSSINRTDYRLAVVYNFGKKAAPSAQHLPVAKK